MTFLVMVIESAQTMVLAATISVVETFDRTAKTPLVIVVMLNDATVVPTMIFMVIAVTVTLVPADMVVTLMEKDITVSGMEVAPNALVGVAMLTNGGNVDINFGWACRVNGGAK